MGYGVVASPEKVEMLARVLNAYCDRAGVLDRLEREHVAAVILAHYESGIATEDGLMSVLLNDALRRTG